MSDKIFCSSTCYDLIDLRAELRQFISSLGLKPIMSDHPDTEFKTFPDKNSIETCLINLRDSDVVIVILSQRYGPSLKDAGFGDYSATHLEYLEAVKHKKRLILFVRDRLEGDYEIFRKTGKTKDLQWIKDAKDTRLFEIIKKHKTLSNSNTNNWYWTFKDSTELKERLRIDLRNEINTNRLNELTRSGNCPLLIATATGRQVPNSQNIHVDVFIENMGNQAAVEPFALIFKADNYKKIVENNLEGFHLNYELRPFKSLRPGERATCSFDFNITAEEKGRRRSKAVVELVYKTIFGDLISDVTEIDISFPISNDPVFNCRYTTKRYRSGSAFEKIADQNRQGI